jgi:hypothetical protein
VTKMNESLRTHRFRTFALTQAAVLIVGVLCLVLRSDAALAGIVLGHLVTFGSVAYGFGTSHDKAVRVASSMITRPESGTALKST